jgi:uncharacterized membrane protein
MFRVSETVSISRPHGEVLEFVADLRNFPKWRANLASSVVVSEAYTDVGARCDERIRIGPRTIPTSCEITAFSAGRSLSFRALSPGLVYDGKVVVEPEPGGSTFTLSGEVRLSGLLRLLRPVIRARMQDGVRREVAAVKARVEALA